MYRNLNPLAMGVTGRQSEIIELALTYGFRGLELDLDDFVKRAKKQSVHLASRFITSAQMRIGGFELPVDLQAADTAYKAGLAMLDEAAEMVAEAGGRVCHTAVRPGTDERPYHENFELHRQRLGELADVLGKHEIELGVGFFAAPQRREGYQYQFIHEADALITLLKSVGNDNLGLALDSWDWHFGGGTLDLLHSLGAARVVSLSIADAPADADAATISEEQRVLPELDGGVVDNVTLLKLLHDVGFDGPVTLSPHPATLTGQTREGIFQQCNHILNELWIAAGMSKIGRLAPAPAGSTASDDDEDEE